MDKRIQETLRSNRIQENIRVLRKELVKLHTDGDEDSLFVRFGEVLRYIEDLEHQNDVWVYIASNMFNVAKGKNNERI